MNLQVCHCCGWSKVTTYQGLRVHQGRMGCTPKGTRIPEPQQQYVWDFGGQTNAGLSYKLDIRNTVKLESTNYYSDMSLQTCFCGWTKMTTYQGLRVHQGKMGCTPKGVRIPREEQSAWKDCWKPQLDNQKLPVTKKVNMKPEKSPETPRLRNDSNPTVASTVKKENKSVPLASSQRATRSKSRYQLEKRFTPLKNSEDYLSTISCNNYTTAAPRIKEEPISSPEVYIQRYIDDCNVTSAEEDSSLYLQMIYQLKENPAVQPEDQYRSVSIHPEIPPAVPREEKDSLLPTSGLEEPKSQLLKEIKNCLEKFKKKRDEKMMNAKPSKFALEDVAESSRISIESITKAGSIEKNQSCLPTQQHPLKKSTETKPAATENVRESTKVSSPLEENNSRPLYSLNLPTDKQVSPATPPVVPPKRNLCSFRVKQLSGRDIPNDLQGANNMREMKRNKSVSPPVPPKRNLHLFTGTPEKAERSSATTDGEIFQLKKDSKEEELVQVSPATPPVVLPKRNLRSFRVKQLSGRDIPNDLQGANNMREMKVKELVQMFSISAAQEKTVRPKEKLGSEHPRVVKLLTQRHSAIAGLETKVQPKVEDKKEKSATDMAADKTPTAAEVPQKEAPSLCEAAKPDIFTNMKVKELARMFSIQEKAAGPKEKRGQDCRSSQVRAQRCLQTTSMDAIVRLKKEDHDRIQQAQKLPDSTCTPSKMKTAPEKTTVHQEHKSSGEASQLSGFSTGPKVKDLARMFSTKTI